MAFKRRPSHTDQVKIQIFAGFEWDEPPCTQKYSVWQMTLCVLAATDSKVMQSGYSRFRGMPGVGSYVSNERLHVEICRWIEYVCGVQSETITPDRWVDLRCAWTSFLSEEILGWLLPVGLEYAGCLLRFDTSTRYRLDSLCIPAWLEIYCDGSVSGKSKCW